MYRNVSLDRRQEHAIENVMPRELIALCGLAFSGKASGQAWLAYCRMAAAGRKSIAALGGRGRGGVP